MAKLAYILTVYIFISIGLYLTTFPGSGIDLGVSGLPDILHIDSLFGEDVNEITGQTVPNFNANDSLIKSLPQSTDESSIGLGDVIDSFTDSIKLIFGTVTLIVNLATMPVQFLLGVSDMPVEIIYLIGAPLVLIMGIAILYFLRGIGG